MKNSDVVGNSSGIDASQNEKATAVYSGLNNNGQNIEASGANAAAVFNTLMGNVGPSAIVVGGCDYHGNPQEITDAKDEECGTTLGKIIELAHRLGKSVVVAGISDGGIAYLNGARTARSDSGNRSLAFLVCYKPTGAPEPIKSQIGSYTNPQKKPNGSFEGGQAAIRDNFFATNPSMVAYILAINYLNLSGRMDLVNLESVIPQSFPKNKIDDILGWART